MSSTLYVSGISAAICNSIYFTKFINSCGVSVYRTYVSLLAGTIHTAAAVLLFLSWPVYVPLRQVALSEDYISTVLPTITFRSFE